MAEQKTYIYGKHALKEALRHRPEAVEKVFLSPQIDDTELRELISRTGVRSGTFEPKKTPGGVSPDASHQGVIASISPSKLMLSYQSFANTLAVGADTALVLLDELQDPHNVGAVIRSAAAFGISGVLIPEHNQSQVTGAVVKVSAGMVFRIPLVSVGNVNTVLRDLKDRGFWIYGLEGDAPNNITKEKFDAPALFVVGNEAKGIRLKTRELCDVLLSIPTDPRCESLNVAASSAVALYAWSAEHPDALKAKE